MIAALPDNPRNFLSVVAMAFVPQMVSAEVIAVLGKFIAPGGADPAEAEKLWQAGPERIQPMLETWLKQQHDAGRLHFDNPETMAQLLPKIFHGSLQVELFMGRCTHVSEDEVQDQIAAAVNLFLAGSLPRQAKSGSSICPIRYVEDGRCDLVFGRCRIEPAIPVHVDLWEETIY
ncbi:TetR/AcrR family transcriptional regulator C-terminal domain-containing protein [Rhodobacteraceae bacterium N5(2021)]|uniref:TetR/AcrR family transcriptional regulator C-terminal domain-containing protein n=1 Tax=Gymnodinialimonas phycosphaerae TaxID=2841589 RepID=A0A975YG57_9RHOB|nr:TetR/AcrR family transcriptional regulator C-terminal domain-containing protein [Gymnodinialimonas phycosphaerae]MBY4891193.1 TetR/AcrR family transcriptional regulator C-terminal domain-containing protein [Gymnodinialimonas phycosphaerae]